MGFNDFWINNNGKKEQLGEVKHGVRKEQVDKKYHNLFDAYDFNKDGTLENSEISGIFGSLKSFAGDNVLDSKENDLAKSLFAGQSAIKDADFMGFVKSVSDSSVDIISSEEKELLNGEKEIKTQYKDGTTETIVYYADGGFKYKKIDKKFKESHYEIIENGKKRVLTENEFKSQLNKFQKQSQQPQFIERVKTTRDGIPVYKAPTSKNTGSNVRLNSWSNEWEDHKTEYSDRYEIETVLKNLGLDLNSEDGKKISERLSKLPLDTLHEINKEDLKSLIKDNELEPTFDNVSNVLELVYGVTLRTDEEFKANQPKLEKIVNQIQSAALLQNLCELVSTWNDQYTDSIGLFGMGSEGIGYLTNKLGKLFGADWGSNHYQMADAYKGYAENVAKLPVLNPEKFAEKFSNVYGEDTKGNFKYDEQAFKKLFDLVQQEKAYKKDENGNVIEITDEFKDVMAKAVNFTADNPNESMYNQVMNGLGEALIMIMTLGWAAEAKGGQMLATSTIGTFSKLGAGIAAKQVNNKLLQGALRFTGKGVKLIGPALNEGTKMATYTLATGTATNIFNRGIKFDQENTVEKFLQEEARIGDATVSSFEFGAFAGVFGSTVTQKVLQKVQGVSSKVTSALSDKFAKGAVDASEAYATILEKSVPTAAGEVAAFCTDVIGFTAFETAQTIVKNLGSEELTPENIEKLLWKEFKDQGYNLLQIKLVSWMLGSRGARTQSMKYLKDSFPQLKGATVEQNGKGYKINLADGRKIECKNADEWIASLHLMARNETAFSSKFDPRNQVKEAKEVVVEQYVKPVEVKANSETTVSPKVELKTSIADDSDLAIIHKMDLENFEGRGYDISEDFAKYKSDLEEQGIETHVLKNAEGKVIGYYQLEPINGNEQYIYSIGVQKELQNTRSSYSALKTMQEEISALAREKGLEKVTLDVEADNPTLAKLYKKFGFVENGTNEFGDIHMEADAKKVLGVKTENKTVTETELVGKQENNEPSISTNIERGLKNKTEDEVKIEKATNDVVEDKPETKLPKEQPLETSYNSEPEINKNSLIVEGSIDENTPITAETLSKLRGQLTEIIDSDKFLDRTLDAIPNEHCAKVLLNYIEECKKNDEYSENLYTMRSLRDTETVKLFVSCLEDPNIPFLDPGYIRLLRGQEDKTEIIEFLKSGVRLYNRNNVNFSEIQELVKIKDPNVKSKMIKMYGSKIFSLSQYYEIHRAANRGIDLSKLDRIDAMSDKRGYFEGMSISDIESLLHTDDKTLDIIDKRGLLRNIEGRERKINSISEILELAQVDDKIWKIIKQRNLLADIEDTNSNGDYTHPLNSDQIIALAKLTDAEYAKAKDRQLLTLKNIPSYYGDNSIKGEDLSILATMDDKIFNEFKSLYDMTYVKKERKYIRGEYQDVESTERRFRINECIKMVTAPDEIKQKITSKDLLNVVRNGEVLSYSDIMDIASKNGDKQALFDRFMAIKDANGKDRFSTYEADMLSELSEDELKIAEKRHLFDNYSFTSTYGTRNEAFNASQIKTLISISDKTWKQMEKSNLKTFVDSNEFVALSKMTEAQWKRAFDCGIIPAKEGTTFPITIDEMLLVTSFDDKGWQRYSKDLLPVRSDIRLGLDNYPYWQNFEKIISLDDTAYNRYKEVMTNHRDSRGLESITFEDFKNIAQVTDEQWSRIKTDLYKIDKLDKQLSGHEIRTIAELDKKEYDRAIEIIQKFQSVENRFDLKNNVDKLIEIAKSDDAVYEQVKPLLDSKFIDANVNTLAEMVKLAPNQFKRINNDLMNLDLTQESKLQIAALPQDKYAEAIKLATSPLRSGYNQGLDGEVIVKLLDLEPQQYDKIKDLFLLEDTNGYQIQFSRYDIDESFEMLLNDEMRQRLKKDILPFAQNSINHIIPKSPSDLRSILELPEEQYKVALENIKEINSVPSKIDSYTVHKIALLDKEAFAKVKKDLLFNPNLGEHQLSGYDIIELIKMGPENYNRCINEIIPIADKSLKLEDFYGGKGSPILTLAELSNDDYNKVKEVLPEFSSLTSAQILDIVKLSENEIRNLLTRNIPGGSLSFNNYLTLGKVSEDGYEKIQKSFKFFNENIKLLKHQDLDVTPQLLSNTIVENNEGLLNVLDIVGETGLKHAVGLKYKGLTQLLQNAASLSKLNETTRTTLKNKLNELPHPEQKLAKLEVISALAENLNNNAILKILDEINTPQMTKEQKTQTDKIFATNKTYTEQIEDFIREFNVPESRQDLIRNFLLEQNLNEKYVTPPSIDEQVAVIDKKIQSIQQNDKIPATKKQAYLSQLEQQKAKIIANPEQYTQSRINDRAMKPLEAQVEAHINLPNQNIAFTRALNKEIYNLLGIDATEELLTEINYDSKYISKLFAGISNTGFKANFYNLINIMKENPNRRFTDIMKELPHNIETKKLFEQNGLDFDRWTRFDAESNQPFTVKIDVVKAVQVAKINLIKEMASELANHLDETEIAKLNQILKDNNLDNAGQKELPKIIKLLEKELDSNEYWQQNNPYIKTFKDHIQIHKNNIHNVEQLKDTTEELYVRLWDNDNVGRNIFFGNHVGCCTSIGSFNSFAAPQHLMNSFVNGIEIVDKAGNSMGNSMCYFAKVDGKLTFVIDSFEANGKLGAAPEVTDAIVEYAQRVCAEMGQPNANIMFGPNYNKVDFSRCIKTVNHTVEIIGRAPDQTYIDAIGGHGNVNTIAKEREMHEIMDL